MMVPERSSWPVEFRSRSFSSQVFAARRLIIAERTVSKCRVAAENVPVFFRDLKIDMDFLFMSEFPFDAIIACSAEEKLGNFIDFGNQRA